MMFKENLTWFEAMQIVTKAVVVSLPFLFSEIFGYFTGERLMG